MEAQPTDLLITTTVARSRGMSFWSSGGGVELGEVLCQSPGAPLGADGGEGGGIAVGLVEEVAAEPEHVCPPTQVQRLVPLVPASGRGGAPRIRTA